MQKPTESELKAKEKPNIGISRQMCRVSLRMNEMQRRLIQQR